MSITTNSHMQKSLRTPNVFELLPKLIWHLDEPVADSAFITTHLVSEFARKTVTVILSGVGGDELFGGYRRYLGTEIARYYNLLPRFLSRTVLPGLINQLPVDRNSKLRNTFRLARAFVGSSHLSPEASYIGYLTVFTEAAKASLLHKDVSKILGQQAFTPISDRYLGNGHATDPKTMMMFLDLKTQLPDDLLQLTDKMSMASSLECRVPFLDHELVEFAARIPAKLKVNRLTLKYILKKAMNPLLPAEILNRNKRGFGAPVGSWLRRDLRPLSEEILSKANVERRGYFDWQAVRRTIDLHLAEQEDHTDHILALINFELWCQIYLDGFDYHRRNGLPGLTHSV